MIKKSLVLVLVMLTAGILNGAYLINENIQNWTAHTESGEYTQVISAGEVHMTQCTVRPTSNPAGEGSIGYIQMKKGTGAIELPVLPSVGTIKLAIGTAVANSFAAFVYLDKGTGWEFYSKIVVETAVRFKELKVDYMIPIQIRIVAAGGDMRLSDIIVTDYCPPPIPEAIGAQAITDNSFLARFIPSEEASSYNLTCYTKNAGEEFENEDLEGFYNGFYPIGWSVQSSRLIQDNSGNASSGRSYLSTNSDEYLVTTNRLSNISSFSFMAKVNSVDAKFDVTLQYSENGTTWSFFNPSIKWAANGSNTGDITNVYSLQYATIPVSGNYFYRLYVDRTSGTIYIDDFRFGRSVTLRQHVQEAIVPQGRSSFIFQNLAPDTKYYYVATNETNGYVSYESNEIEAHTKADPTPSFPLNTQVEIEDLTVSFASGSADLVNAEPGSAPNSLFTPLFAHVLDLLGTEPWEIQIDASAQKYPWIAYRHNNRWQSAANITGNVGITIEPSRSNHLEILAGAGGNPTLPVILTSFTVELDSHHRPLLTWVTQSESNMLGYRIYRGEDEGIGNARLISALVEACNSSQQQIYCHFDEEELAAGDYWYWIESLDLDGSNMFFGPIVLDIDDAGTNSAPPIPLKTALGRPYPNPFNPRTQIPYSLHKDAETSFGIYNLKGQRIWSFPSEYKAAGSYKLDWNGRDDRGEECASGMYWIVMEAGKQRFVEKLVMMK